MEQDNILQYTKTRVKQFMFKWNEKTNSYIPRTDMKSFSTPEFREQLDFAINSGGEDIKTQYPKIYKVALELAADIAQGHIKESKNKTKMVHNEIAIRKILEAIDKAVDAETKPKPKTQGAFSSVKETGEFEMDENDFTKVSDKAPKDMETKPTFPKVSDKGSKGGATGVKGDGKPKEVKLENANRVLAAKKLRETIELLTGKKVIYVKK